MFVRRGRATVRLSAGLMLAAAVTVAPAAAQAAPAPGEIAPMAGEECAPEQAASASATSTELGGSVEVTGDCYPIRSEGTIEIFMQGDEPSRMTAAVRTEGTQSVHATFTPEVAGEYTALVEVGGKSASSSFSVTEADTEPEDPPETEDPTDPPTEDPTDPPTDEPSDPPTEEPTEDPTDPPTDPEPGDGEDAENGEDPGDDQDPDNGEQPGDGEGPGNEDGTGADDETGSGDDGQNSDDTEPATPAPAPSPERPSTSPTSPFPGDGDGQDSDEPEPSASGEPSASAPKPGSPDPAFPGPATNDFPAATPEEGDDAYSDEQRDAASLAVRMASLFAHGVSDGEVGISPAEADLSGDSDGAASGGGSGENSGSDGNGPSDGGGDELAETGAAVTGPATLTALALTGGAGLLWYHRRRNS